MSRRIYQLPAPNLAQSDKDLENQLKRYLDLQKIGRPFLENTIRNKKDFHHPESLQKLIVNLGVNENGTSLDPSIFNLRTTTDGNDDFYDSILRRQHEQFNLSTQANKGDGAKDDKKKSLWDRKLG
eukprot:TRINITY_DN22498_c0_g1_i2.p1 TRINITY_DN22498_c0_g1~~TRINITY_DN22498_c0_g1_i2.p1  ORF type:complete len:126 (+),score=35.71 TRINITY_DN22498_c0_g1_i2:166-543(+)